MKERKEEEKKSRSQDDPELRSCLSNAIVSVLKVSLQKSEPWK